ncbi:hypothetical protein [Flavobacterium sp.]|uniref:hypothetical protein n=1 Tax=Flavobacterium sp. TaxID=239 RepID=UPI003D152397
MEQSKFEEQLQQKMQAREIMPSETAWDRLDAMLSVTEMSVVPAKREKKGFVIAASILLMLSLGVLILMVRTNDSIKNEVVTSDRAIPNKAIPKNNVDVIACQIVKSHSENESLLKQNKSTHKTELVQIEVVKTTDKNNKETLSAVAVNTETIESEPVLMLEKSSDERRNDLAQSEKLELKIDAQALLNQVDGEMQQTFRQNVFKRIKKDYNNAKEVLASRNQESSINH